MLEQQVNNLIGHLFRHEAGKMAAVLTRLLGFNSLDLAEDIVQDTLLQAMSTWKFKGIPENPGCLALHCRETKSDRRYPAAKNT